MIHLYTSVQAGELGKLRARQATALVNLGKVERAIDVLEEGVTKGGPHTATLKEQLKDGQTWAPLLRELREAACQPAPFLYPNFPTDVAELLPWLTSEEFLHFSVA